jgi:hypothetical protein
LANTFSTFTCEQPESSDASGVCVDEQGDARGKMEEPQHWYDNHTHARTGPAPDPARRRAGRAGPALFRDELDIQLNQSKTHSDLAI